MTARNRRNRRTWATDQLFLRTKTAIYAVIWYELPTGETSEVEVTTCGQKFTRTIANMSLEENQPGDDVEKLVAELIKEIDKTR
jgi:hypothetical protein